MAIAATQNAVHTRPGATKRPGGRAGRPHEFPCAQAMALIQKDE
jgi:hypothetical protein